MTIARMAEYDDFFRAYWHERFVGSSLKGLVEWERQLSVMIDSDTFDSNPLSDEILVMFDLVRSECVRRCASIAENGLLMV